MEKLLFLLIVSLMLAGCIAVPVYDSGYYRHYAPYSYGYVEPEISVFVPLFYGGHGFHGGHGFRGENSYRGGRR